MDKQQAAALKTLTKARKLIARKNRWIKGAERMKIESYSGPERGKFTGTYVSVGDGTPVREIGFCAWGAIHQADGPGEHLAVRLLKQGIRIVQGKPIAKKPNDAPEPIFQFNDAKKRTLDEVLAAFDAAIKMIDVDEEAVTRNNENS